MSEVASDLLEQRKADTALAIDSMYGIAKQVAEAARNVCGETIEGVSDTEMYTSALHNLSLEMWAQIERVGGLDVVHEIGDIDNDNPKVTTRIRGCYVVPSGKLLGIIANPESVGKQFMVFDPVNLSQHPNHQPKEILYMPMETAEEIKQRIIDRKDVQFIQSGSTREIIEAIIFGKNWGEL